MSMKRWQNSCNLLTALCQHEAKKSRPASAAAAAKREEMR